MNLKEARGIVTEKLSKSEILAQMAEECAELGKAGLKLRRTLNGMNPTTVGFVSAKENLLEECGDVLCCAQILLSHAELQKVFDIAVGKTMRWAECLEKRDKNETE